jgi:putative membrane protein
MLVGGLMVAWITSASPWSSLDHCALTFHMLKHLLLMLVAAPLILYGLRSTRRGEIGGTRRSFVPHPAFCWWAAGTTVIAWHLPIVFQLALHSHAVHLVEDASFLAAGLLFWSPVIHAPGKLAPELGWFVPLYLFLAALPCDALSAFLVFCGRVVYPVYEGMPRFHGLSALEDQEFAGAFMWVSVTFAYLVPAFIITLRKLSPVAASDSGLALLCSPQVPISESAVSKKEGA